MLRYSAAAVADELAADAEPDAADALLAAELAEEAAAAADAATAATWSL